MNELEAVFHIFLAMVLGAVIGLEREMADKPVGLRTNILLAGAACLLVYLGFIIVQESGSLSPNSQGDAVRVLEAIIVGVSFVGGGAIMRRNDDDKVENLTTAATAIMTAAIGACVALDKILLAISITVLVLMVNLVLRWAEGWLKTKP